MTLIQTDTSISPGNSGGGLFNANGELIGVVNAKSSYSEAEGIGFAIPINTAMDIAQQLIENGAVAPPGAGRQHPGRSGFLHRTAVRCSPLWASTWLMSLGRRRRGCRCATRRPHHRH